MVSVPIHHEWPVYLSSCCSCKLQTLVKCVTSTHSVTMETYFPANLWAWNPTTQISKHSSTTHKKLKPDLVILCDLWLGNRASSIPTALQSTQPDLVILCDLWLGNRASSIPTALQSTQSQPSYLTTKSQRTFNHMYILNVSYSRLSWVP